MHKITCVNKYAVDNKFLDAIRSSLASKIYFKICFDGVSRFESRIKRKRKKPYQRTLKADERDHVLRGNQLKPYKFLLVHGFYIDSKTRINTFNGLIIESVQCHKLHFFLQLSEASRKVMKSEKKLFYTWYQYFSKLFSRILLSKQVREFNCDSIWYIIVLRTHVKFFQELILLLACLIKKMLYKMRFKIICFICAQFSVPT